MKVDIQVVPAYIVIDYLWELIKLNTGLTEADYSGRIPIISAAQEPEFANTGKPYIVFTWAETTDNVASTLRSGHMTFVVYANTQREIGKIANLINTELNDWDDSATRINLWKSDKPYAALRFTSVWSGAFDGPVPEETEGAKTSAVVIVRFRYVADYEYTRPPAPIA